MRFRSALPAAAACALLAACSEGGGGDPYDALSYNDRVDAYNALLDTVEDAPYVDPSTLPTTGSTTYEGQLFVRLGEFEAESNEFLLGQMRATADFADDAVRISANRFVNMEDEDWQGTLRSSGATIDRTADPRFGYTFQGDFGGTLTNAEFGSVELDGTVRGDMSGGGDYIEGRVFGDMLWSEVDPEENNEQFEGGFVGERD